jgi:hypothetical protein
VREHAAVRRYTAANKARIWEEYDQLDKAGKGALMRREGRYSSLISSWRTARDHGAAEALARPVGRPKADPPDGPNQVWQLGFSEYETTTGGVWRLAGVTDYFTKIEHGWHISPTCTGADAIAAVQIAIAEAERLAGRPLASALFVPQPEAALDD